MPQTDNRKSRGVWGLVALGLCFGEMGCADGEGSIALVFPNDVVRSAIRRLRVEAYSPDSGGTGLSDRTCSDFIGEARIGMDPLGTPVRGDYQCPEPCADGWFTDLSLGKVPAGRQIIYVLAYASNLEGQMPILEGCSDGFDSTEESGSFENVNIDLDFVLPDGTRLVKAAGDRQVGRGDSTLGTPLTVEVQADAPISGAPYVIPGLPVVFESESPGYDLVGETQVATDSEGRATVDVSLPAQSGTGFVRAASDALAGVRNAQDIVRFAVSVTPPTQFNSVEVIQRTAGRPVAVRLGNLAPGGTLDAALVTCEGSETDCDLAPIIDTPGRTALTVIRDIGSASRRALSVPVDLGILPVDLQLTNMREPRATQEIAVLNARRDSCQQRACPLDRPCACFGLAPGAPCPCEGSEIRLFQVSGDDVTETGLHTLTASNGVGMTVLPGGAGFDSLVVASRGRMRNERPCSRINSCNLPNVTDTPEFCESNPLQCGCPPNEFCECDDCSANSAIGFCRANDKILDFLSVREQTEVPYNEGGCQNWVSACGQGIENICECRDQSIRGGRCDASDACGCSVPSQVRLGELSAPEVPLGIVAGALRPGEDFDLVVPSVGGLGLAESAGGRLPFTYLGSPSMNAPIDTAVVTQLDEAVESNLPTIPPDVVWIAKSRCTNGFEDFCPRINTNGDSGPLRGCLGVYFTAGQDSVFNLRPPTEGGCRRHDLAFEPAGLCVGRFNSDDHVDVAVASETRTDVLIFAGDGRGGLLDPPEQIALPGGDRGGPLACGRLDADAFDDIVVMTTDAAGRSTGAVVLRTGN